MTSTPLTFVTAFIIPPNLAPYVNIEVYIQEFKHLAISNIPICLFTSKNLEAFVYDIKRGFPNVFFAGFIEYQDLWTTKLLSTYENISLPEYTCPLKDTHEFMNIMNSKTSFMRIASEINHFQSSHFCWIDFAITKIFKNKVSTLLHLSSICSNEELFKKKYIIMPGFNSKPADIEYIKRGVFWRFCGGLFIADKECVCEFDNISQQYLKVFIQKYHINIWEVNLWAWMEMIGVFKPTVAIVYDHDDNMILKLFSSPI